jgi:hypothetical protein
LTAINNSQYDGYHDIDVGISITLECFANHNITWGYPKNYIPFITYQFSSPTFEYRSTLTIVKTNYSHTGSYGVHMVVKLLKIKKLMPMLLKSPLICSLMVRKYSLFFNKERLKHSFILVFVILLLL